MLAAVQRLSGLGSSQTYLPFLLRTGQADEQEA